jgi:serine/threonine protein kinase
MEAEKLHVGERPGPRPINWEAFYRDYRKPGYVPGFEIINKLGGGVFGMVFKARKESIGKDYAIKFLKVDDEVVRDAVVRELKTVDFFAQIDHPNLVSIEDRAEVDGIPYIVMSYAGDETLRGRLETGALPREEALRIFIQAARGVQALHERSLVHFDLKPANIFLKGDIARVGDYGLSKLITESRNSLSFGRGTPYYMAPEMLQRRGDHRSDVYSLGIVLYECLIGDVPFKGDSEWEVLRKHETEPVRVPEHVQEPERTALLRCLEKDPDRRFQTVAELLHTLQAPAALGESMLIPPGRPARGERAAVAAPAPAPPAKTTGRDSPYGMPWQGQDEAAAGGLIGGFVHLVFRLFELVIFLVLVPVRAISVGLGQGVLALLQLPFRMLGLTMRLAGYVIMAATLIVLLAAVVYLFAMFVG